MPTQNWKRTSGLNRILLWVLDRLVLVGYCAVGANFLLYFSSGEMIFLAALSFSAAITWAVHRWSAYLGNIWTNPRARRKRRQMPNNSRSLRKRCLGYISALATPFMGVRVMWVHLLLSILLPLCPGWVDYLLNIDALYRIPMMVNIITTERHLPFNLTACTLTLILVPGYAIYAAMKFKTAGTNVDWLGVRPGTKHRLRTIIQLLLMVPLVSLTMWKMWGTTLPAQDYLVPGHLASPAGMMLLVIMPLYGIAAILPHMLTMFAASLRPTAAVTGNGNSDAAKEPAVVPRQNKAKKARRRSTSARKAARH